MPVNVLPLLVDRPGFTEALSKALRLSPEAIEWVVSYGRSHDVRTEDVPETFQAEAPAIIQAAAVLSALRHASRQDDMGGAEVVATLRSFIENEDVRSMLDERSHEFIAAIDDPVANRSDERRSAERAILPNLEFVQSSVDLRLVREPTPEDRDVLAPMSLVRLEFDEVVQAGSAVIFQLSEASLEMLEDALEELRGALNAAREVFGDDLR